MTEREKIHTIIRRGAIVTALLVVISYGLFEGRVLLRGPQIEITSPAAGELSTSSLLVISGTAKNVSFLHINDRQVFTSPEGVFSENMLLSYGYNAIKVTARDKFGRIEEKVIEVIYK